MPLHHHPTRKTTNMAMPPPHFLATPELSVRSQDALNRRQKRWQPPSKQPSDGVSIASSPASVLFCCTSVESDDVNIASDNTLLLHLRRRLPLGHRRINFADSMSSTYNQ